MIVCPLKKCGVSVAIDGSEDIEGVKDHVVDESDKEATDHDDFN